MGESSSQPSPRPPDAVANVLDEMTDGFVVVDRDWSFRFVNRRMGELFGRAPEEFAGRNLWKIFPEVLGGPFQAMYERVMHERRPETLEAYVPAFGRWFEARAFPSAEGILIFLLDVTDRKEAEQELARREQRYRTLAHAFSSVVWEADQQGRPLVSESWDALTGRGDGVIGDAGWLEAVHPDDQARVQRAWETAIAESETFDCSYRVRVADGAWRHVRARGVPVVEEGRVLQWIGVIDDVTEQVEAEDALRRAALEDALTGLANRTEFLARVRDVLDRRRHGPAAVLYVDIDRFKRVNDNAGHACGDEVLRTVAGALREHVRPSDAVSRLSGDEFAVLCPDLPEHEEGVTIARRLGRAIADPDTGVCASIGVAFAGAGDRDPEALLRRADAAMYEVKARGGDGVEVFDEQLRERVQRRAWIEDELRAGLARGDGLDLHFQPIVSLLPGWPSTAEALLRWRARDGATLPAQEVVTVAERAGLISALGGQVLARGCREAARWNATAAAPIALSVNVSAQQLGRPDELVGHVTAALESSGLAPGLLWLEITETMLIEHGDRAKELLATLRGIGVRLALDDFGVGYSSLSYLHRLPVDAVKVDRSFVQGLPDDAGSGRIVEAVVGIGRAFRTGVVAEGVETAAQLAAIREAGCGGVQGFGLSRPVPSDRLPAALAEAEARAIA